MRHARAQALAQLAPLLAELRLLGGLTERRPGIFYRNRTAFLHFHEDPKGLFVDLRVDGEWQRFAVNTAGEREGLVVEVRRLVGQAQARVPWPNG